MLHSYIVLACIICPFPRLQEFWKIHQSYLYWKLLGNIQVFFVQFEVISRMSTSNICSTNRTVSVEDPVEKVDWICSCLVLGVVTLCCSENIIPNYILPFQCFTSNCKEIILFYQVAQYSFAKYRENKLIINWVQLVQYVIPRWNQGGTECFRDVLNLKFRCSGSGFFVKFFLES